MHDGTQCSWEVFWLKKCSTSKLNGLDQSCCPLELVIVLTSLPLDKRIDVAETMCRPFPTNQHSSYGVIRI